MNHSWPLVNYEQWLLKHDDIKNGDLTINIVWIEHDLTTNKITVSLSSSSHRQKMKKQVSSLEGVYQILSFCGGYYQPTRKLSAYGAKPCVSHQPL
jgi:hypothetical protein